MYKIVKAHEARISKVGENHHRYSLIAQTDLSQRSLIVIEAAEITEKITADNDSVYYLLSGTMTIDDQTLKKGDCCLIPQGDTVIVAGTFRALLIT